jgi:hypothetical protein
MRKRWEIRNMRIHKMWRMFAVIGLLSLTLTAAACGTLVGAGVGAAGGAAIGAGTGYGAGKGALIGTGVGAVGGAIYDISR